MDTNDQPHPDVAETADADLVLRTRSGDSTAFGELWRRHYRSGIVVAGSITSTFDADDLVQEAYARIYQTIAKGGGPTGSFRAYLFTVIRNTAAGWGRARRETGIDELENVPDPDAEAHATDEALDRSLTAQAFRSLPTRWQEVLWYTEIEQMKPAEVAPLLGLKATAVAQLAFRAREGLREAWIQAHLRSAPEGSDCRWTIERLGAYARGNLGRRDTGKVDAHLADCARCAIVAAEAKDVSHRLALVLLPLTLGAGAATAYLATVQGGSAPIVALAAGASGTLPGAVTVTGGAVGGAANGAGAGGGTAAAGAGAGAGAAAATGGVFGSIGAMVSLVATGVVVAAAAITASIVIPQMGAADRTSIAAADAAPADEDASAGAPAAAPPTAPSAVPSPGTVPTTPPAAPPATDSDPEQSSAAEDVTASAPVQDPQPAPSDAPTPSVTPAPTPTTPTPTPTPTTPTPSPTAPTPKPTPVMPTTPPTVGPVTITVTLDPSGVRAAAEFSVTGEPGMTVVVTISEVERARAVLDDTGRAAFDIPLGRGGIFRSITVGYELDGKAGPSVTVGILSIPTDAVADPALSGLPPSGGPLLPAT